MDVVCLQETKIKEMSTGLIRSLGVGRHLDWRAINSRGAIGGVLVFWDNRVVELLEVEEMMFKVSCQFKNCVDGLRGVLSHGQGILARPISDHFPILLEGGGLKRGPSPFKFENMWLEEKGFMDQMKKWWGSLSFAGSFSFVLDAKLRALKEFLKIWNKDVFGLIETKKNEVLSQVEYWDELEKHSTLSLEDCEARKEAKEAYKTWVLREEISLRQKSRELWLKEGDNNTRFFHRMANVHSRRNWLYKLKVDDCWHTEENDLKNSGVGAFKKLYTEEGGWRPGVEGLSFMRLASNEAEGLEIPFAEGEVFAALSDLGKDKAPVPKKGDAEYLKDFRPISLVGSLYKLLAKVLANRIKKVMGKVISEFQNTFVEGEQILDAALIANEAMDSRFKDNVEGVLCKLDIEKTYDHVSWSFLLAVLKKMGFGERWIKWIDWRISTVKFSVLINGSPSGFFQSSRGLRQGDPLSPYLFVIAMEVFSSMLRRAISGGFLSGVEINLEKSELIPMERVHAIEGLALKLGCKVGGLPSCYLGLPLGAPFNSLAVWDGVEERFRKGLLCGRGSMLMREALWRRVISLKYGEVKGRWRTQDVIGRNGVGLWKAIRKKWWLLDGRLAYHVGNGQRVRFWKDKWCRDGPLCESFSSLFSISMSKNVWVSEVWNPVGDGDDWTPLFARAFHDWEIDLVERLLQKIHAFKVQREEEDKVIWTASIDGAFSVAFFAWEASWDKVLTLEQLQRRGSLWKTVKATLLGWNGVFVGKRRKRAWQMVPLCIFWSV
ncbi:Transposon TX1 uncharacterized 149 kDa protein [Vitis vinifera]|uniref:Transposon TX1 uncharacterized 149 kDa protein n=1 Tax=Vitis vinifera TaxID=29760 RepID=A0A438GPH7_VITVI|nr:Transposon TX1 uncharacterized 149 kDa protein [Vitis vinifera]